MRDIVDGTLRLGVMKGALGEAFNLASGTETKIVDVANMINEITGQQGRNSLHPQEGLGQIF